MTFAAVNRRKPVGAVEAAIVRREISRLLPALEAVERYAKPHQSLLQCVRLGHHELRPLHRSGFAALGRTLFPSTGKLYDNVVTAVPMVNTYFLPPSPPPLTDEWRPRTLTPPRARLI